MMSISLKSAFSRFFSSKYCSNLYSPSQTITVLALKFSKPLKREVHICWYCSILFLMLSTELTRRFHLLFFSNSKSQVRAEYFSVPLIRDKVVNFLV